MSDYPVAIEAARRRVALEPLDEVGYRDLMRLQSAYGDRAGAISTFHHCASVLEQQLGVPPDPATARELDRVLGGTAGRPPRAAGAETELVGRSAAMATLAAAWEDARSHGRATVVLVRGGAGIGKTRLATEFDAVIRAGGGSTATAQCFGSAGRVALAPVADWLRSPAVSSAAAGLDEVWRQEVERLVPFASARPDLGADRAAVDAWQRHRFFEGVARAFLAVDGPLLLVIDNVQWCDEETLGLISFLVRLGAGHPLMVVATLREDAYEQSPVVAEWAGRLAAAGVLSTIGLTPLERDDTAELVRGLTGRDVDDASLDALLSATGGYPLYVVEAVRSGFESAAQWADVLKLRLQQMSPEAREIAGLASAVGRDFSLELLTEASDLDANTVVHSVDELWRARILREVGGGYDFSHDLLRDVAYDEVSPPRRWLLHRRLAQALELLHAGELDAVAVQLAEQYDRGGQHERAIPYYRVAADGAAMRFAHVEAIRLNRRALQLAESLPPSPSRDAKELAILRAMAPPINAHEGYSSPALRTVLERVVQLSEESHQNAILVQGLVGLWGCRFVQGNINVADQLAKRALAVPVDDPQLIGQANFAVAGAALTIGRLQEAVDHFALSYGEGRGTDFLMVGTRAEVHALAWLAHAYWLVGERERAVEVRTDAVDRARHFEHPYTLAVSLAYAAITDQLRGDRVALAESVLELRSLTSRHQFAYYGEWGLVLDGWLRGGEPGIALARQGISNLRRQGSLARMPYWLALLAELSVSLGRPEEARAALDAARVAAETSGDLWWLPEVLRLSATVADPGTAEALRAQGVELATKQGNAALLERYER